MTFEQNESLLKLKKKTIKLKISLKNICADRTRINDELDFKEVFWILLKILT